MKAKNLAVVFLMALAVISCKDGKKTDDAINVAETPIVENGFKVAFDLIAKKDDNFHLYYTEDNTINFTEEKSLWLPFKGSDAEQEVKFVLPEDIIPTNFRVDFGYGVNKEQSDIVLKKFKMKYYDKTFEVKDSLIFYYFYPNKDNTILDNTHATLKRIKPDQATAPSIYPNTPLSEEILKMVK
jgi:hypothetical protein